jgi:hypothetical protein
MMKETFWAPFFVNFCLFSALSEKEDENAPSVALSHGEELNQNMKEFNPHGAEMNST